MSVQMTTPETLGALADARDAIDRNAWKDAFALLQAADRELQLPPDWLELLAETAWWNGRLDDCIDARERSFAGYLERGEPRGAAVEALRISHNYESKLNHSLESAWFKRAETLLDREPESVEHAYLARRRAANAAAAGRLDEALALAEYALELGTRCGDRDTMALALHDLGRFRITKGDVEQGLGELDEATLAAMHGEIGPYATAVIYCNVIEACRNLADYRRAGEWTEAAKRWCERQAIAGFPGQCRVDRAEVMKLRGAWAEAEQEARDACDELKNFRLPVAARAFYELGEIRLRVGDLAGATAAFDQASELGLDAQPGTALLKLAAGNPTAALTSIGRALDDQSWDRLARARLLPAQVEIALAAGEPRVAEAAVDELRRIAEAYGSEAIRAHTDHAFASVQLANGDPGGAAKSARSAFQLWREIDAPFEAARARALLGVALRELGDDDGALIQLRAASTALEQLGAAPDARRVATLLAEAGAPEPEGEVLAKTFVFTDVVESTKLIEAIGDPAWESLVRWHDQTLRSLFAEHGGEEVDDAGDGFFVAFETPRAALACAVAIQQKLAEHRREHGFAPQVRIGVHATDAAGSGGKYRGRGVHEAARIGALAGGAEIVASAGTVDGDFAVTERRSVALKGLTEPVDVVTIEWR
jgi:class 3 adenylate cyclase